MLCCYLNNLFAMSIGSTDQLSPSQGGVRRRREGVQAPTAEAERNLDHPGLTATPPFRLAPVGGGLCGLIE